MARGSCTFRQRDLTAALKAAKAAGVQVRVKIDKDGTMTVIPDHATAAEPAKSGNENEWDEAL